MHYEGSAINIITFIYLLFSSELLQVIKDTDNDDLTEVLQEIIETYDDCIVDIAVELCTSLVS